MSFNCVVFLRQNNVTAFLCSKVIHTLFTIHNNIGSFTTQYIFTLKLNQLTYYEKTLTLRKILCTIKKSFLRVKLKFRRSQMKPDSVIQMKQIN